MEVPASKHGWTATAYGQWEGLQQELGIEDREALYLYLLDGEGMVRWTGKGAPAPDAIEELLTAAREIAELGGNSGPKGA